MQIEKRICLVQVESSIIHPTFIGASTSVACRWAPTRIAGNDETNFMD